MKVIAGTMVGLYHTFLDSNEERAARKAGLLAPATKPDDGVWLTEQQLMDVERVLGVPEYKIKQNVRSYLARWAPSQHTRIIDLAFEIAQRWREDEGVSAEQLDELEEVTRRWDDPPPKRGETI